MNKVILLGNLTKDPEIRQTSNGVNYANFTIAVSRKYKDASGERPTDFIYCTAWRQTADFISRYFTKGQSIAVEGAIQTSSWEDKDGNKQYRTGVTVSDAYFTGRKSDTDAQPNPSDNNTHSQPDPPDYDVAELMPFDL